VDALPRPPTVPDDRARAMIDLELSGTIMKAHADAADIDSLKLP
jgi:hypothetical protein